VSLDRELGSLAEHNDDRKHEFYADGPGIEAGESVLADAVLAYREAFAERLVAAYALGSLAHGGFSPAVSDVDLGIVLADPSRPSDPDTLLAVARDVRAKGTALHERLSVFWGTLSSLRGDVAAGRFPPLDRLCLIDHGRILHGEDVRAVPAADASELVVAGAEFALEYLGTDDVVEQVRQPKLLLSRGARWMTKVVLFPVRFLFTAESGDEGTNEAATARYVADEHAPGAALVAAALALRTGALVADEATAMLLDKQLLSLYLHYTDDHVARLTALRQPELAEAFRGWHDRLRQGIS
jgi:predicted nucleotidyltransferase